MRDNCFLARVLLHFDKSDRKFEKKLTCGLENDTNMTDFHQSTWNSRNLGYWWDPLIGRRKCMSLKFTGELCVMTMKNEEELTCRFKTDMRNLKSFDQSTQMSQKFSL